jgi:hypothetical protein
MNDNISTTTDIWLCAVLVYLGYRLCEIADLDGKSTNYVVACPRFDFEILEADYRAGHCPLSDAKAFVSAFNHIIKLQKEMRRRGEQHWNSPEWIAEKVG